MWATTRTEEKRRKRKREKKRGRRRENKGRVFVNVCPDSRIDRGVRGKGAKNPTRTRAPSFPSVVMLLHNRQVYYQFRLSPEDNHRPAASRFSSHSLQSHNHLCRQTMTTKLESIISLASVLQYGKPWPSFTGQPFTVLDLSRIDLLTTWEPRLLSNPLMFETIL